MEKKWSGDMETFLEKEALTHPGRPAQKGGQLGDEWILLHTPVYVWENGFQKAYVNACESHMNIKQIHYDQCYYSEYQGERHLAQRLAADQVMCTSASRGLLWQSNTPKVTLCSETTNSSESSKEFSAGPEDTPVYHGGLSQFSEWQDNIFQADLQMGLPSLNCGSVRASPEHLLRVGTTIVTISATGHIISLLEPKRESQRLKELPPCPVELMLTSSKRDPLVAKAEPISNGGSETATAPGERNEKI
ncbi:hypothetical protein BTVI_85821 [Pitangus sulphuratus]|nr:hypothetical protein BTVI_85821 [Pitangus sulphuratus]